MPRSIAILFAFAATMSAAGAGLAQAPHDPQSHTHAPAETSLADWLQFGSGADRGRSVEAHAISAADVARLTTLWRVALPEASDGTPLYVSDVANPTGGRRDLILVESSMGRLTALDASNGSTAWTIAPPLGPRWTTSSPAVEPDKKFVFVYTLDGYIHRYLLADGTEVSGNGWPELVTLKGDVEKGSSALTIATAANGHRYLYATTSSYPEPGDEGDYQGHLTTIDIDTGKQHVFNAACSDRDMHFTASGDAKDDCQNLQAGIWARSGAVYDPVLDRVFISVGNGVFDAHLGGYNWASSIVALRPDGTSDGGTPLDSYTPDNFQRLNDEDLDLSSTTVALLPLPEGSQLPRLAVQTGKDSMVRIVNLADLSGQHGPRHLGGELALARVPQGGVVLTRTATWLSPDNVTWIFIADWRGLSALTMHVADDGEISLRPEWQNATASSSPVIAGDVLYTATDHQLTALAPETGDVLGQAYILGGIHFQSPIVVNGTVFITDGSGYLYALAPRASSRASTPKPQPGRFLRRRPVRSPITEPIQP